MFLKKLIPTHARLNELWWHIKRSLLPPVCLLCHHFLDEPDPICKACQNDLPKVPPYCLQCAEALPSTLIDAYICGQCLKNPPPFDRTFVLYPYETPIPHMITQLKFHGNFKYAHFLSMQMISKIKQDWYENQALPDLLLPVPLHPQRLIKRGFNQALELAKPVAKAINRPLDLYGVTRIKPTIAQSGLSKVVRKQNITGAFMSQQMYHGKHIAIIDDVATTLSTVTEISHLLKQQGANMIHIWCAARRMI